MFLLFHSQWDWVKVLTSLNRWVVFKIFYRNSWTSYQFKRVSKLFFSPFIIWWNVHELQANIQTYVSVASIKGHMETILCLMKWLITCSQLEYSLWDTCTSLGPNTGAKAYVIFLRTVSSSESPWTRKQNTAWMHYRVNSVYVIVWQ